jgi:integrase
MPLTELVVRNAKPQQKPYRLFDSHGLYVEVTPSGSRLWRLKYRYAGKEKRLSFGVHPEVTLKEARERRDDARKALRDGADPGEARKRTKAHAEAVNTNTFEAVAREWFAIQSKKWVKGHADKIIGRLKKDIFPRLRGRPIAEIKAPEILAVLRKIEERGAYETAHRAMQSCSQVFGYAIATGRAEDDPTFKLHRTLTPVTHKHHASIKEPSEVGALLRAIDGYTGSELTRLAMQLAPLIFVRPGELRAAEWIEFNFEAAEWRIPAHRMKMRTVHVVPLSKQAMMILGEIRKITGEGRYVFPSVRTVKRPMSDNTLTAALRRMGYSKEEMTVHGFRSMASTLLNEQGWNRDAIERQLAHSERDKVRAAYNYAEHLPERRRMMQAWSDYLDGLRKPAKVVALHAV